MRRHDLLLAALLGTALGAAASADPIPVRHIQRPMHKFMVARSADGKTIASGEFLQSVLGDEVTMRMTYKFVDGSIDDETTTYRQRGTFQLIRNHHIQKGPFFSKPIDFSVEAATGIVTSRSFDSKGQMHIESRHMDLPVDLANGFVGTLLLNVPHDTAPFRAAMLAPVGGGRLVQLLISPDSEQKVSLEGKTFKATVFRIHPELGVVVRLLARLLRLEPKDVMVWILEGDEPAVAVIVGQLGGYGPVISSDLVGSSVD